MKKQQFLLNYAEFLVTSFKIIKTSRKGHLGSIGVHYMNLVK